MRTTSSPSSISCVKQWPFDLSISLHDKPCIVSIIIPTIVVWYGIDGERRKIKAMRVREFAVVQARTGWMDRWECVSIKQSVCSI